VKLITKFSGLSFSDKRLLLSAVFFLLITRVLLIFFPFRFVRFISKGSSKPRANSRTRTPLAKERIIWAVEAVARHIPFVNNCLAKAMVINLFFRRANYQATLHIGVTRSDARPLDAHAWVESDGRIVTGQWERGFEYHPLAGAERIFL